MLYRWTRRIIDFHGALMLGLPHTDKTNSERLS